jgi:hypothetical protein
MFGHQEALKIKISLIITQAAEFSEGIHIA